MLKETESAITISVYPNPAKDFINVKLLGQSRYQVRLYNLQGKMVLLETNADQIDVTSVASGTYLLEVLETVSGERIVEKVIIE